MKAMMFIITNRKKKSTGRAETIEIVMPVL